jgi:DNA-binding transcriptional LysR family regulator
VPLRIHSPAIRYFDAVRRTKSIREAARQLNIASSAVNRQIIKLEEEIGAPLFERLSGGLVLTPIGEALARHVIAVHQDLERTATDLADLRGAQMGHITVATVESVAASILPDVIAAVRMKAPRITFTVLVKGSFDIPGAIVSGEVDVGVAFSLRKSRDLRQVFLSQFQLGAVVPPGHALAKNDRVALSSCLSYPLILATPDLSITSILESALAQGPSFLSPVISSGSIDLMRRLVLRGQGVAFQTRVGLETSLADGTLVHIPLDSNSKYHRPLWSDLGIYTRAGRVLPSTTDRFVQALAEELRAREGQERSTLREQPDG